MQGTERKGQYYQWMKQGSSNITNKIFFPAMVMKEALLQTPKTGYFKNILQITFFLSHRSSHHINSDCQKCITGTATANSWIPACLPKPGTCSVWTQSQWDVHPEACSSLSLLSSSREWGHSSLQTRPTSSCTSGDSVLCCRGWKL